MLTIELLKHWRQDAENIMAESDRYSEEFAAAVAVYELTTERLAVREVPDIKIQKALLWLDGIIQSNPGMKEALTRRAAMLKASE